MEKTNSDSLLIRILFIPSILIGNLIVLVSVTKFAFDWYGFAYGDKGTYFSFTDSLGNNYPITALTLFLLAITSLGFSIFRKTRKLVLITGLMALAILTFSYGKSRIDRYAAYDKVTRGQYSGSSKLEILASSINKDFERDLIKADNAERYGAWTFSFLGTLLILFAGILSNRYFFSNFVNRLTNKLDSLSKT